MGRCQRIKKVWQELTAGSASDRWSLVEIPLTTQLYILPVGARFEDEDAPDAVCVLEYIGAHEAYVRGLMGRMDREIYGRIFNWLRSRGIRRIRYRHKGREVEL